MITNFLSRFVQDDLASFGDPDMNEDMLLDVQTITDALMTTGQKVADMVNAFALTLL